MDAKFGQQPVPRSWYSRRYVVIATTLNAAIALVTLSAVSFHSRRPAPKTHHNPMAVRPSTSQPGRLRSLDSGQPEEALDQASSMRVESFASVAPAEYYEILLRAAPEEIASIALQFNDLPTNSRTGGALLMFFQAWAELDGKAALQGAYTMKDLTFRRKAIDTVLRSMSASGAPEAAMFLKEHSDPELSTEVQSGFFDTIVWRWADIDPAAAAKFFEQLGPTKDIVAVNARRNIAWAWGTMDPQAALDWIQNQQALPSSDSLFDSVLTGWSRSDPAAAMIYAAQHLDTPGASEAVASVALEVLNRDPKVAANWLRQLPPGEARSVAEDRIARAWADRDPVSAAQWAQQTDISDDMGALFTVAQVWAAKDWEATRKWLDGLYGDARDVAVSGAVMYADVPASESLPLAMSINDGQTRLHTVRDLVETWASRDREAAATWIMGSGLSGEQKQELLGSDIFSQRSQP